MEQLLRTRIDRRRFLQASLATAAGLAAAACGAPAIVTPGKRPTLRLTEVSGVFGYPTPFAYIATPGYLRTILMYDTLLWEDGEGNVLDWMTTSHSVSADNMTYTFNLRSGLKWSDGQPLTAEDVAFTYNYFLSANLTALTIAQPYSVSSAKATGPLTVEITLSYPDVTFERATAGALPIVPKHIWESIQGPTSISQPKYLVASGPYRMTSFDQNSGNMSFVADDSYFLGPPYVKQVDLVAVGDELSALRGGAIDLVDLFEARPEALASFRADPTTYNLLQGPPGFTYPLFFNMSKGGPLTNVTVRRAIVTAINRKDMLQRLLGGQGYPGSAGFLPPSHAYYSQVEQYPYSTSQANSMLESAGYKLGSDGNRRTPDGSTLSFKLVTENAPVPPAIDILTQNMKAIGISVDVRSVDLPTLFGIVSSGQFDLAVTIYPGPDGTSVSSDPDYLRRIFSSKAPGGPNRAVGYTNAQFDQLAAQQQGEYDTGKRKQLIAQMQQILATDVPVLPLYYGYSYAVSRRSVFDNIAYTPGGFATGITSVDNRQLFITGQKSGTQIRRV